MRTLLALLVVLALPGCATYRVECTPAGGKSIEITSTRAVTALQARITNGCGIDVQVGTLTGGADFADSVAAGFADSVGGVIK